MSQHADDWLVRFQQGGSLEGRRYFLPAADAPVPHAAWMAQCLNRGGTATLRSDDIAALAAALGEHHYPSGSNLFRMGDAPARIFIVRRGAVGLSRTLEARRVVIQLAESGDVVGDIAVFVRTTQPFDAWVLEDSVVLSVDSLTLCALLERRPRLARYWLVSVSQRMAGTEARLAGMLAGGLEAQLASLLLRRADNGVVHLNQARLADLVGVSRTSVNRVLKTLQERGVLIVRYGAVEVLNEEALTGISCRRA